MDNLTLLFKDLEKYNDFNQNENIESFLDKVDEIIAEGNPGCVQPLLKYFDDDTDYVWVLESIKLSLEHLPKEIYVKEVVTNINILMPHAKGWAVSFLYPILNEQSYFQLLKKFAGEAPKKELMDLLTMIEKESPTHQSLVQDVRSAIA